MDRTLSNIFKGDKVIWMVFFFLCIISVVEVYSASSQLTYKGGNYIAPVMKHVGLLVVGIVAMVVVVNVKCKYFKVVTPFMLLLSVVLLIAVYVLGQSTNGAMRWIPIFGVQFQPSEIAKGTLVLATAQILSALQTEHGADNRAFKYIFVVSLFIVPLILVENFSTAALLCLVIFFMMVYGRVSWRLLGAVMGFVVIVGAIVMVSIFFLGKSDTESSASPMQLTETTVAAAESGGVGVLSRSGTWLSRIKKFIAGAPDDPLKVDLDKEAQESYAKIAIASSNVVGKGPGNSVQCDFLPQAYSDFIYAIIIEEMGIEGALFVAMLYIILLFRVGRIAGRCANTFPAFLVMGLALLLVVQALVNMCVAVGLSPVTGQPLPLISKGGTSTIINCIYIGVILSVSRTAKRRDEGTSVDGAVAGVPLRA